MRYLDLFSGVGTASLALNPLGWEHMAFSEVDEFPAAVLANRWPEVPNLGDIRNVDWGEFIERSGRPDVIVGGSPCTSFSVAGERTGLDGESRLMYEYIRAVRETSPRWFIWENVPHVLTIQRGGAFGLLLSEMAGCGYQLAWRVLDSQWFGVAQRRRRVFLVGYLGDRPCATAALFNRQSMQRYLDEGKEAREDLAGAVGAGSGRGDREGVGPAQGQPLIMASGQANSEYGVDVCTTLTARQYKDPPILIDRAAFNQGVNAQYEPHIEQTEVSDTLVARGPHAVGVKVGDNWTVRRLTPKETERLQGMPDDHTNLEGCDWERVGTIVADALRYEGEDRRKLMSMTRRWSKRTPDGLRYKCTGNSFSAPVVRWIGERIQMVESIINR